VRQEDVSDEALYEVGVTPRREQSANQARSGEFELTAQDARAPSSQLNFVVPLTCQSLACSGDRLRALATPARRPETIPTAREAGERMNIAAVLAPSAPSRSCSRLGEAAVDPCAIEGSRVPPCRRASFSRAQGDSRLGGATRAHLARTAASLPRTFWYASRLAPVALQRGGAPFFDVSHLSPADRRHNRCWLALHVARSVGRILPANAGAVPDSRRAVRGSACRHGNVPPRTGGVWVRSG